MSMKWKTVSFKRAINAGIIVLSEHQIKRCTKNGITEVGYSLWADMPCPEFYNETGETVFRFVRGRLVIAK